MEGRWQNPGRCRQNLQWTASDDNTTATGRDQPRKPAPRLPDRLYLDTGSVQCRPPPKMLYETIAIVRIRPPKEAQLAANRSRPIDSRPARTASRRSESTQTPPPRPPDHRINNTHHAQQNRIVLAAGQLILRQGGVIRDLSNWGVFHLPRAISLNQSRYAKGHYFVIRYDSGIRTHQDLMQTLRIDPRVIRSGGVKLGDGKLESLSKFGEVQWKNME